MKDRREQRRPRVHFPAELRARAMQGQPKSFYGRLECRACDVSIDGARLIALSEEFISEGAQVVIKIRPSRFSRSYVLHGAVRWGSTTENESVHVCGISFDDDRPREKRRWNRFMNRFLVKQWR